MKKIFIIEDEIVVAKGIEEILTHNGYIVSGIATNYQEAKLKLHTTRADLVLCDINLNGEKTGIELMKGVEHTLNIPFIFISAYSDISILREANTVSAYAYITKPFNEKQLLTTINKLFVTTKNRDTILPTEKELAVLKLIALGYQTKQIAEKLSISHYTVETHRKNLMHKYESKSMPELICLATQKCWVQYKKP